MLSCRHWSATHLIWCRQLTMPSAITAINVSAQTTPSLKKRMKKKICSGTELMTWQDETQHATAGPSWLCESMYFEWIIDTNLSAMGAARCGSIKNWFQLLAWHFTAVRDTLWPLVKCFDHAWPIRPHLMLYSHPESSTFAWATSLRSQRPKLILNDPIAASAI